jgi:tRNA threonylcarbamoyladenosine biosynthesis protein TsaB
VRALAIETSGGLGSVALVAAPGGVLAEETFQKGVRHGQAIVPAVERVLARASVKKEALDFFAVGTGPGSYTGLRVGIASAKALAIALEKPIFGVPSFDAAAAEIPPEAFEGARAVVLIEEARKDRIYWGLYRPEGTRLVRAADFEVREAGAALEGVKGPAVLFGGAAGRPVFPHARAVAKIALERAAMGERDALVEVLPLYLRPSVPEEKREESGRR